MDQYDMTPFSLKQIFIKISNKIIPLIWDRQI